MKKTSLFKQYILSEDILVMPGAHDALCARIIETAGHKALTMGGYSASASLLGRPDVSLLTLTEMADCYRRVADLVDIPLFVDGDTGFGGVLNVRRTVKEYERAGADLIFVEAPTDVDQMRAITSGIEAPTLANNIEGGRSPVLEFIGSFGAQGCWDSNAHYFRFLDNARTRAIASAQFEKYFNSKLLAPLAFGDGLVGRRDSPIEKVANYQGLKMRTSGTAQATMYKALGAVPVGLSSKEIYTALQRGTIQGATSGISRWRRSKLYEIAREQLKYQFDELWGHLEASK